MSRAAQQVIEAFGLAAGYNGTPVWEDVSFTVEAGEFIAVLGPNGAGKSTLFRMLLGLLGPRGGRLEVFGRQPRRGDPAIGYVPQGRTLDPDLPIRGRDLVHLGLDGHRWGFALPAAERGDGGRVRDAIRAAGAEGYADRPVGRVSGGEQQRLLLGHALVGRPRLLLLDEPLANLDLRNQAAMAGLVAGLARDQGLTVLLIAHDVNPLLGLVDRVLYVARGRMVIGSPRELITTETLSRLYGTHVEVLRDSHGRVFVVGLEEEYAHPHHEADGST
jgi:zinc/manganese transport system ATP-binding protein